MSNDLILGRGMLYFDRFATGTNTKTGERYLGATPNFAVTAATEDLDHYGMEGGVKVLDESATLQADFSGTLGMEHINAANLALFFLGSSETSSIAAQSGTEETFEGVGPGLYYQVGASDDKPEGYENVTVASVTDDTGATTYVENTDYTVDGDLGRIYIVEGGAIPEDSDIIVTFDVAEQTQSRIISGQAQVKGALRFIADNQVGSNRNFYMPKVTLSPNGDLSLKGDEWMAANFNLKILQLGSLANVIGAGRGVVA